MANIENLMNNIEKIQLSSFYGTFNSRPILKQQNKLFDEWKKDRSQFVSDGIVDEESYLSSKIKILYLLKEVNGGNNWDLCEFIRNGARSQTWNNISRWTKGILNLDSDIPWNELETITQDDRKELLKPICVVNVKKSSGGNTSKRNELYQAAYEDRKYIMKQIYIYDPDIIICCGTSDIYFYTIWQYEPDWKCTKRGIWYVEQNNKIVVSYSHPEARVKDSLLYYGLIDAIKEIYS